MPRDGLNQYSPPPGTNGITDYTIESTKYNTYVADVTQDLNLPRPIVAGGTGASSATQALFNLSGETATQVVTNWDSKLWLPGSFYAATSATGIAPVAGHAFAGVCYLNEPLANPPTNQNVVTEATDLTDPANPDQYIRVMAAGVWGPWTRLNQNTSSANLGEYTFNNQVTFPPAAGQIRFNNATENSTTEVFISHLTAAGVDNTTQITSFVLSGVDLVVQDKDEGNKYKVFTTTAAAVLSGGDFRVTVTLKTAGIDVVSAQRMLVAASGEAQRVQQRQLIYAAPFDAMAYNGMQVNGSVEVSQQLSTTFIASAFGYGPDGWIGSRTGPSGISYGQAVYGSGGFAYTFTITVGTAQASMGAGDQVCAIHYIEGYRVARLGWGTPYAQPVTIGFWTAHHRPGTYSGSVRNNASGSATRSCAFSYTHNVADALEFKTVTIPGDTAGTWAKDNTLGMNLSFAMACGATATAPSANVWLAGDYVAVAGQVNAVAATSDVFRITGLIVLPGTEAPPAARAALIMRPYDQELLTCQRYWRMTKALTGIAYSTTQVEMITAHPNMRVTPTANVSGSIQITDVWTANFTQSAAHILASANYYDGGHYNFDNFTGLTAGRFYMFTNISPGFLTLDARL